MMNKSVAFLQIDDQQKDDNAIAFCRDFIYGNKQKFIFGTNEYAACIANSVDIYGFIDEFTKEIEFCGKPVLHSLSELPNNCLVVSSAVYRPLTVRNKLNNIGIRNLDYFSFKKYSGINLLPAYLHFYDDFISDFRINRNKYELIFSLLSDTKSRSLMTKIINFRLTNNLNYMNGFKNDINNQYFEDFLQLRLKDEIFLDIGCYDGFTSLEFIKRCPEYNSIHAFEPDPINFLKVYEKLNRLPRIHCYNFGIGNENTVLKLKSQGDASQIAEDGDIDIQIKRLDDVIKSSVTLIKMDIEGAEISALEGAKQTIISNHPRIAVSVYHCVDDLWKIPMKVLSIRDDYNIFLRHYTENVTETVMYFIPK